ncbi:MAG: O-antigen ligase family protein [Candidatus Desulforudis sp.]|nr:O-antigen ligase family protein [Desulforudis sp.]
MFIDFSHVSRQFLNMVYFPIIYLITILWIRSEEWMRIFKVIMTVALISSVLNIIQFFASLYSIDILFVNTQFISWVDGIPQMRNASQGLILSTLIISAVLLVIQPIQVRRRYLLACLIILFLGFLVLYARYSYVAVLASSILLFIIVGWRPRLILIGILFTLSFLVVLSQEHYLVAHLLERVSSIYYGSNAQIVSGWRLGEYKAAAQAFLTHPFFGTGIGAVYRDYFSVDIGDFGVRYVHSAPLWLLVNLGILGSLPFFWIITKTYRNLFQCDPYVVAFSMGIICWFLGTFFHPSWIANPADGIVFGVLLSLVDLRKSELRMNSDASA